MNALCLSKINALSQKGCLRLGTHRAFFCAYVRMCVQKNTDDVIKEQDISKCA